MSLDYDHTLARFRCVFSASTALFLGIGETLELVNTVLSTLASTAAILLVIVDYAHGLQLRERLLVEAFAVAVILAISLFGLLTAERAQVREDGIGPTGFELVLELGLLNHFLGTLPSQRGALRAEYRVRMMAIVADGGHYLVFPTLIIELIQYTFALHGSHSRQLVSYFLF